MKQSPIHDEAFTTTNPCIESTNPTEASSTHMEDEDSLSSHSSYTIMEQESGIIDPTSNQSSIIIGGQPNSGASEEELLAMISDDTISSSSVASSGGGTIFIPADIYDDDSDGEIIVASEATFIPVVNPSTGHLNNSLLSGVHFPNQNLYFTSKNGTTFRFIPFLELVQELNNDNTWSNVQFTTENPQNNFEKNNSSSSTTTTNTSTSNSDIATRCASSSSTNQDNIVVSDQTTAITTTQTGSNSTSNKRKRDEEVECEKKVKMSSLELVDLPVHIKLKILGYLHVPFMECYSNYQTYELNISRIFGKFKNDPFSTIYLMYTSLGMKLKQQHGGVLPIAKRTKDLRILVDPKIANLDFISGFTYLQKLSIWLTDSNLMNLFQKQAVLFPKIVYLSLVLFNDLSDTHYSETFLKMPNLRTLQIFSDLERCSIKAKVNLPPRLTTLRLLNYEFIDFSFLCHNTQITSLTVVDSCNLSNIDKISSLTQLKRLKINEEETMDGRNLDLNAIFQLETLERLSIPLVSFKYRLNGLTKLHSLRIHIGDDLNLTQIEKYANYILECKSLKIFKFEMSEDCPAQIQNKFLDVLSKHSSIEYLKTSSLITSSQVIKYIFQNNRFPALKEIDFSNAEDLTIEPFKLLIDTQLFKKQFNRVILPMNFNSSIEECFGALLPNTKFSEDFKDSYEYFDVCDFDDDDSDDEDTRSIISELMSNADGASYYDDDSDSEDDQLLEHLIGH
ncbi:predicted protein [Naegleria gruberi]|uniref:Predicted protein n=1 Tax=Naegleria gruberi TaxID=5762 RepID=D2VQ63_NAEGR|nr:uncharacterized protein NAEGRDRAFT_51343 [Naegleria gruberi]EFC40991.1 predicted protein [Naegleria gruberi]|eukprot:XP_002673735.1 predicted protein [Naegleria gruberi strain NEG-M]